MFRCRIADLNIEANVVYKIAESTTKPFHTEFDTPDIVINSSLEIIEHEKAIAQEKMNGTSIYEKTAVFRLLAEQLPKFDALVLHSCAFKVKDKVIALGACSGTGKTTHMMLWKDMLGDDFEIINGDKPIVRFLNNAESGINPSASFLGTSPQRGGGNEFPNSKQPPIKREGDMNCCIENNLPFEGRGTACGGGVETDSRRQTTDGRQQTTDVRCQTSDGRQLKSNIPYAYGTPWAGKENLYNNIKAELTDICRIVRSETNRTRRMSREDGIALLMQQVYMPFDPEMRIKTIELIYKLADSVRFWEIACNMEPEAAKTAYEAIFGE